MVDDHSFFTTKLTFQLQQWVDIKVEIFNPTGAPKGSGNGKNARNPTELVDGLSFITQKQATFSYVDGFWSYVWGSQQHLEHMG